MECIVAQRLARVLCEKCKEAYVPDTAELAQAGYPEALWPEIGELFRPVGCKTCANTGFRGRIGIYEVLRMSDEIERLTVERAASNEIIRAAIDGGMVPLRQDGLDKARQGLTSIAEVLRVVV